MYTLCILLIFISTPRDNSYPQKKQLIKSIYIFLIYITHATYTMYVLFYFKYGFEVGFLEPPPCAPLRFILLRQ